VIQYHACANCSFNHGPTVIGNNGKPIEVCYWGQPPERCQTCESAEPYHTKWCPEGSVAIEEEREWVRIMPALIALT